MKLRLRVAAFDRAVRAQAKRYFLTSRSMEWQNQSLCRPAKAGLDRTANVPTTSLSLRGGLDCVALPGSEYRETLSTPKLRKSQKPRSLA